MITRQIDLDEETDRILTEIARDYKGNVGDALADLVRAFETLETFASESEDAHSDLLKSQLERSDNDFRDRRFSTWDDVKRRNGL